MPFVKFNKRRTYMLKCPNCKNEVNIPLVEKTGVCNYCNISLIENQTFMNNMARQKAIGNTGVETKSRKYAALDQKVQTNKQVMPNASSTPRPAFNTNSNNVSPTENKTFNLEINLPDDNEIPSSSMRFEDGELLVPNQPADTTNAVSTNNTSINNGESDDAGYCEKDDIYTDPLVAMQLLEEKAKKYYQQDEEGKGFSESVPPINENKTTEKDVQSKKPADYLHDALAFDLKTKAERLEHPDINYSSNEDGYYDDTMLFEPLETEGLQIKSILKVIGIIIGIIALILFLIMYA